MRLCLLAAIPALSTIPTPSFTITRKTPPNRVLPDTKSTCIKTLCNLSWQHKIEYLIEPNFHSNRPDKSVTSSHISRIQNRPPPLIHPPPPRVPKHNICQQPQIMAAAATTDYRPPEPPPTIAIKSKVAAMDAIEDITFGSVSHPTTRPLIFTSPY